MKLLRRRRRDLGEIRADNILWGVPRREGYSDTDDPLVHEGLVQHAFLMGEDDQALCGLRPARRLSRVDRTPRAQLALAGPANPRCEKCEAVLAAGTISSPSTFVAQARPERSDATAPGEPSQPDAAASPAQPAPELPPPVAEAGKAAEEDTLETADDDGDHEPPDEGNGSVPPDAAPERQPTDDKADSEPGSDTAASEPAHDREDSRPAEDVAGEQPAAEPAELLVTSHPSTRVRRGGLITIPVGRQSVLAELPASAHGAAIAAEIDGGAAQIRVQSVALHDDGTLRITLNQPTTEAIDVMWFVV
jgi:hypothetical protein